MNSKRTWIGLGITATFGLGAGELVALANLAVGPVTQSVVLGFLGTALGAFVARRGFVLPAIGLWLLDWSANIYFLYRIAEPVGQASVIGILQYNLFALSLSLLAVVAGALFGQALARRSQRIVSAT